MEKECECCHYPAKNLKTYGRNATGREKSALLCEFCATTLVSNMWDYSNLYTQEAQNLGQAMCYIGNKILDAIEKK